MLTIEIRSKIENKLNVDLRLRELSMCELLIERNLASLNESQVSESDKMGFAASLRSFDSYSSTPVVVTSVYSPYCFYVQDTTQEYMDLEAKMQSYYNNEAVAQLKSLEIGQMCVAKYSEDQAWYRAIIKDVDYDQSTVSVFFVDFGNEDVLVLSERERNVCAIIDEFKKCPVMALKCSLQDVEPVSESQTAISEIADFMFVEMAGSVWVKFLDFTEDFYYVDINFDKKYSAERKKLINLRALLVEKKYVKCTNSNNVSVNSSEKIVASPLRSPQKSKLETIVECASGKSCC